MMTIRKFSGCILALTLAIFLLGGVRSSSSLAGTNSGAPSVQDGGTTSVLAPVDSLKPTETGEFVLPPLPYGYDALEPFIDTQTMRLHHDKHHAGYVENLNGAIAKHPELKGLSAEDLLKNLDTIPEDIRTTVRNNGGGHLNHTLFWSIMTPHSTGKPSGAIAEAINATFGDFETFKEQFNAAGKGRFGSGWVWLVYQKGQLHITTTANQDSPVIEGGFPLMGNDVWEHAYYLKYQNRRADYLNAWWNVLNWDVIGQRFEQATRVLS